jgi:hypothetical protein
MRTHRFAIPLLTVAGVLLATAARADTLEAPAHVVAQQDGSFSYTCTFTKGPGISQFAGSSWVGVTNVQGGLYGDCFCVESCPVFYPGSTIELQVFGRLIDPQIEGSVSENVAMCSSPGASATTTVHPYGTTDVPRGPVPIQARLWNEPNPFSSGTTFHFAMPQPGPVSLRVYDLAGRLVASVVETTKPAGIYQVPWDVARGARIPGGVLFAKLSIPGRELNRTILVIR